MYTSIVQLFSGELDPTVPQLILIGGSIAGGALVGLGVSKDKAIRYESEVRAGKFMVTMQGDAPQVERAETLLNSGKAEVAEVVPASAA